jgi:hypothetical protein
MITRTLLLLCILTSPLFANEPTVTNTTSITETKSLSEYQMHGSNVPTAEQMAQQRFQQSMSALSSARAASIAAASAWYEWDKGAAAERDIELARLHQMAGDTNEPTHVAQTRQ